MEVPIQTADSRFDAIYAWAALAGEAEASPPLVTGADTVAAQDASFMHASLVEEPFMRRPGWLPVALFLLAILAGNTLFDWFAPAGGLGEILIAGGGALLALRLYVAHPALGLALAFCLGDPLMDIYGHCIMGL